MDRAAALAALQRADLCLILTRALCVRDPLFVLASALAHGVGLVQVREKNTPRAELLHWVSAVRSMTEPAGVPLIVNDDPLLALAAGADGVHVGAGDPMPAAVRSLSGGAALVLGVSCHNRREVEGLTPLADYAGLGALFTTTTRADTTPCPLDDLKTLGNAELRPIFGIGGLDAATLPGAVAAGLRRAAVSSAICGSADPARTTAALRKILTGTSDASNVRGSRSP